MSGNSLRTAVIRVYRSEEKRQICEIRGRKGSTTARSCEWNNDACFRFQPLNPPAKRLGDLTAYQENEISRSLAGNWLYGILVLQLLTALWHRSSGHADCLNSDEYIGG